MIPLLLYMVRSANCLITSHRILIACLSISCQDLMRLSICIRSVLQITSPMRISGALLSISHFSPYMDMSLPYMVGGTGWKIKWLTGIWFLEFVPSGWIWLAVINNSFQTSKLGCGRILRVWSIRSFQLNPLYSERSFEEETLRIHIKL